jgi:hypothetical protein
VAASLEHAITVMVKSLKFIAFVAQYGRHESNVHDQASHGGCEPGSVVALHAASDIASGQCDMPIKRLVVGSVSERRGLRVRMSDAISQLGRYGLPGAGWRDHAPRGQRIAEKTNPCALQFCSPTWESLGGERYNGQSSVSQFADRRRVQAIRAKQSVGRGTYDLLAEITCRIKILICAAKGNAVTPRSITRKTKSALKSERLLTSDYGAKHGTRTRQRFRAFIAAYAIRR